MNNRIGLAVLAGSLLLSALVAQEDRKPDARKPGDAPARDGLIPQGPGKPPFGPPGPGGPAFGPGGFLAGGRKLVKQFDKDADGRLNHEERQAAREFLKKERASGGGRGRPAFGPAGFLTKPILEALDTDKNTRLTKDEVLAGLKKFLADSDKEKKGTLDAAQLGEAINRSLPQPQGFPGGPPGRGPGGPGPRGPGGPPGDRVAVFGLGNVLADAVFRRADANKDGHATHGELVAAAEALFKEVDKDHDGKLDETELGAGVSLLMPVPAFGMGFGRENREPPKPGPRVDPADVKPHPADVGLYEPTALRTLFLEFENKDWEAELADFHGTDVEVPAALTVDGKKYPNVGIHFRGMSSYGGVPAGYKRSLNLSLDFADPKQRLYGYKTLNLLNSHEDPTFLHTVLYSHIARQYMPAPKANLVKLVINGESWGVYVNAQQFDKAFLAENFPSTKGVRWKVRGSPGGGGGLEYLGDNIEDYKRRYEIKTDDDAKAWKDLVALCRTLNETPLERLEEALKPILHIDGVLWFLALENVLINGDGYWIRASDYCIFRDEKGKFHIIPHDMNEVFQPAMMFGPGFAQGPGFGMGMFLAKPVLDASDSDKDGKVARDEWLQAAKRLFQACDPDKKGALDEKAIVAGIHRLLPPPDFRDGPRPGGRPDNRPEGRPDSRPEGRPGKPRKPDGGPFPDLGLLLGGEILKRADTEKAGKVTLAQFIKAAETFFQECDKDKNHSLDEAELSGGINQLALRPGVPGDLPGGPFAIPIGRPVGRPVGGPPQGPGPVIAFAGPGAGPGPRPGGVDLDPLIGLGDELADPRKPLRSRLLAVPSLRTRYLQHVRTLAEEWLDWNKLKPVVEQYRALIDKEVEADTRKLSTYESFQSTVRGEAGPGAPGRRGMSLRAFAEQRRNHLLNHPEIKKLGPPTSTRDAKGGGN